MILVARVCCGCGRPRGTIAINNAYWHLKCYRAASVEDRERARKETTVKQKERSS